MGFKSNNTFTKIIFTFRNSYTKIRGNGTARYRMFFFRYLLIVIVSFDSIKHFFATIFYRIKKIIY